MEVSIDATRCQGHALCLSADPAVFDFDDEEGKAFVARAGVPDGSADAVRKAAANCPESAIAVRPEGGRP
ncbi:ferredoxin [Pseudonocardia pini]|uniref:ferredoxin n=1 Tax=Pseudonocardia pini TaxID=2758030 RepID=UPI0015F04143|nr:ferredoxin [Pseudonocardia pini]